MSYTKSVKDRVSVTPVTPAGLQVRWSDTPQPMADILKTTKLPLVIKVWTGDRVSSGPLDGGFDFHQPMLLYTELNSVKVYARNVINSIKDVLTPQKCHESGPVVVIPMEYQGWFRPVDEEDMPITTVANVARIMPVSFLSTKLVTGFRSDNKSKKSKEESLFHKIDVPPGLFTVDSVHEDFVRYTNYKNVIKRKLLRCLRCYTEKGIEMLLPFDSEGAFYTAELRKTSSKISASESNTKLYSINQWVYGDPSKMLVMQLMYGQPPSKPCGFTGLLKVFKVLKDHTVVACTLDGSRKLLELPVAPMPLFVKALNSADLLGNKLMAGATDYMLNNADNYIAEMKVRFNYNVEKRDKSDETAETQC